jgi:hypothetical protein
VRISRFPFHAIKVMRAAKSFKRGVGSMRLGAKLEILKWTGAGYQIGK